MSKRLQKTTVLQAQNLTKPSIQKTCTKLLLVSLLATCQPSYAEVGLSRFGINSDFVEELNTGLSRVSGNSDFLTELNKINYLPFKSEDSSQLKQLIAQYYQPFNNHSFNYVDTVAVNGNNDKQELRKLSVSVSHRTIADVFLCLSFAILPFVGELRLALALVRLWWGGHGNKPFIRQIPCAVLQRFSNLPTALILGQSSKNLPFEKVL